MPVTVGVGSLLQIGDFVFRPPVYYEWLSESVNTSGDGDCLSIESRDWVYKVYFQEGCSLALAQDLMNDLQAALVKGAIVKRRLTPDANLETMVLTKPGILSQTDLRLLYTSRRTLAVEMRITVAESVGHDLRPIGMRFSFPGVVRSGDIARAIGAPIGMSFSFPGVTKSRELTPVGLSFGFPGITRSLEYIYDVGPAGLEFSFPGMLRKEGEDSLSHTYIGYNTVGASQETITAWRFYLKKVTLASAGLISSIGANIQLGSNSVVDLAVGVYSDNAGTPYTPLGMSNHGTGSGGSETGLYLVDSVAPTYHAPAWIHRPLGLWLPAGDYWLAVVMGSTNASTLKLSHDGSGSDRWANAVSPTKGAWSPWAALTPTTSSNQYSIRASLVQ